jgi:PAS domain S-box-containing protein
MNKSHPATTIILTCLALAAVLAAVYLSQPRPLSFFHFKAIDWVMGSAATLPKSDGIAIVDLDDDSLATYGQWPWPRYRFADLINGIRSLEATIVASTIILSEPDRTSPAVWKETIGRDLGYRIDFSGEAPLPLDHDRYLAETLVDCPCVLGFEFLFKSKVAGKACSAHPVSVITVSPRRASPPQNALFDAQDVICNLDLFSESVSRSGFLNAVPDPDGILRRMPVLIRYNGQVYPSLPLATLMMAEHANQVRLETGLAGSQTLVVAGREIPLDGQGNILVNFTDKEFAWPSVSAKDILDGTVKASALRDKLVIIGSSAAGWDQVYQTPVNPISNAAGIHACALDTLLSGNIAVRQRHFMLWESAAGVVLAVLCCLAVLRRGIAWNAVAAIIITAGMWQGSRMVFHANSAVFSPLLPTAALWVNYVVLTIVRNWKDLTQAKASTDDALVLLKSSESNLNAIIKTIPDIVFRLDTQGRIVFISPAISKYKKQAEEMLGRPIFDLVAEEDRKKAQYRINERRTGDRATVDLELRLSLSAKGQQGGEDVRYFSISAEGIYQGKVDDGPTFLGTQGIARDVTEQKRLEDQLLQAQKMEAIGSLAAGVAHDLNNILSGLVSYPDLLLLELPEDSPLRDKVLTIQQSGKKAAAVVQDLLTLARRGVAVKEVFNLNTIVTESLASPEMLRLENELAGDDARNNAHP